MSDLKDCPFCGSYDVDIWEDDSNETKEWYMQCNECWAQGCKALTEKSAIRLWNLRNNG